jgi:hypothetical protein
MGRRLGALLIAVPVVAAVACSSSSTPPGELILSLQTDMSLPKDVDHIQLIITANGNSLLNNTYPVGPGGTQVPATLGILAGADPSEQVDIRVIALQNATTVVLREVLTTVPADRTALLRVPIQWLCYGQDITTSGGQPSSSCPPAGPTPQTCIAGVCTTASVDSSSLPSYDPTQVFGGATGPDQSGGTCIDTVACFADGFGAAIDTSSGACEIAKPSGGVGINVALVQGPKGAGICGPQACLLPLDANTTDGTGWTDDGKGHLVLPPAVCTRLATKAIESVAVTTACATKTEAVPTCGPWNSSSTKPATVDAGAPLGAVTPAPGSGTVSGAVDCLSMTIADGILNTAGAIPLPTTWFPAAGGGAPASLGTRQGLFGVLSDTVGTCAFFQSSPPPGSQPASTSFINMYVFGPDATTAVGPGTYTVANPNGSTAPTGPFAIVWFSHEDATCNLTAAPGTYATSGSVTIGNQALAGTTGTFQATFGQVGSFSGSFTAPPCGIVPDGGTNTEDAGTICPPGVASSAVDAGCIVNEDAGDSGLNCASFANIDTTQCSPLLQTGCSPTQECAINPSATATCVSAPAVSDAGDAGSATSQGKTCNVQSDCNGGTQCVNNICETYCCDSNDCLLPGFTGLSCQQQATGTGGLYGVCH